MPHQTPEQNLFAAYIGLSWRYGLSRAIGVGALTRLRYPFWMYRSSMLLASLVSRLHSPRGVPMRPLSNQLWIVSVMKNRRIAEFIGRIQDADCDHDAQHITTE